MLTIYHCVTKQQEGVDEKQNEEYYNKYSVHHQNLPQEEKGEETS